MRVRIGGTDDHVGEAVAIDVAGRGNAVSGSVELRYAAELEAVAAVEARQVEIGGKATGLAEHHIARAGTAAVRVGLASANNHVSEAVPVHITRRGDRDAAVVPRRLAAEPEAVVAVER
jgi:hypothetical protein